MPQPAFAESVQELFQVPHTQVLTYINLNKHMFLTAWSAFGERSGKPWHPTLPAHHHALSSPGEETALVRPSHSLLRFHRQ